MKAIVYNKYGPPDVLQLKNVDTPVPAQNEVLITIHATAVNSADWRLRKADPFVVRFFFGLRKPKIKTLGGVFSGIIQQAGKGVTLFKPGDSVFGSTGLNFGAYAEFVSLPENGLLAIKPDNISHEEAAVVPFGANTALHFLKKANIAPGQRVMIYGASGAVGTAAVQLAKFFEAEVTGVCSTANIEMVRSIGADRVIDYTKEDVITGDEKFEIIVDTVGKLPVSAAFKALKKKGRLILVAAGPGQMIKAMLLSLINRKKAVTGVAKETTENISFLKQLLEDGKLKAVIDKIYSFEQMAEAHAYVEKGHKKGNVAIRLK